MPDAPLTVLVIGSGGREHALVKACKASPLVRSVHVAPGNAGMDDEATRHPYSLNTGLNTALSIPADLVIIGPEAPLCDGLADRLRAENILVYGPNEDAAQLEGSKVFAKQFMLKHGIPTAASEIFTADQLPAALDYLQAQRYPLVIKASGLAAGKGVIIAQDQAEAAQAVQGMLSGQDFGAAGAEIVIEECLTGPEVSIMLMVSGSDYVMLPPSQDHKRIGEGDTGPNTGGMGAYAPALVLTVELAQTVRETIIAPTLNGLQAEGYDYRGTLYIGLMLTPDGPKVLEYNVRFGDPECQILLPLLETDPVQLMHDCARSQLAPYDVRFKDAHAMIVVLASADYPGPYPKGEVIQLPDKLPPNTHIIHAGTARDAQGRIVTNGGRVLGAVGIGPSFHHACNNAYRLADKICWPSITYRRDIGWRQTQS